MAPPPNPSIKLITSIKPKIIFNISIRGIPEPFSIRCCVLWFYRNDQSQDYVGEDTCTGEEYRYYGDYPYNRRIDIEILGKTTAYTGNLSVGLTSIKPFGHCNLLLHAGINELHTGRATAACRRYFPSIPAVCIIVKESISSGVPFNHRQLSSLYPLFSVTTMYSGIE